MPKNTSGNGSSEELCLIYFHPTEQLEASDEKEFKQVSQADCLNLKLQHGDKMHKTSKKIEVGHESAPELTHIKFEQRNRNLSLKRQKSDRKGTEIRSKRDRNLSPQKKRKKIITKKNKRQGGITEFSRRIVFQSAREAIPAQTIKCTPRLVHFSTDKFLSSWRMRVHNLNFGNTVQPECLVTLCLKLPLETKTAFITSMPLASQATDGPFPPCLLVHVKKNA